MAIAPKEFIEPDDIEDDVRVLACKCEYPLFFVHADTGALECGRCFLINLDWALVRVQ